MSFPMPREKMLSTTAKYAAKANTVATTTKVVARTCFRDGQVTHRISICSS